MFSMSVATSQQSWGQSVGEEEVSSRMGMSELSSTLLSTPGGPQESFPKEQSTASFKHVCQIHALLNVEKEAEKW